MEYEGSPMYDEYPDRVMLDRICRQICQDIERESAAARIRFPSRSSSGWRPMSWAETQPLLPPG